MLLGTAFGLGPTGVVGWAKRSVPNIGPAEVVGWGKHSVPNIARTGYSPV